MAGRRGEVAAVSMQAAADLRLFQYHIVRMAGANMVNVASHDGAAFQLGAFGVLQNKPNTNEAASVGRAGESAIIAGASYDEGDMLTTNGSGRAVAATSGDIVIAQAIEAATADGQERLAVLCTPWRLVGTN